MKNQYVGDINDYGKYGLLRFLSSKGIKIGLNWYLTEKDLSSHGKYTRYLQNTTERYRDPELFDALCSIGIRNDKSVRIIQEAGLIDNAVFFDQVLNLHKPGMTPAGREIERRLWYNNSTLILKEADLIFADPDNGMTTTRTARMKDSEKYVLPEEIREYYQSGKNVVYYCHKGRRNKQDWEKAKTEITKYIPGAKIAVLSYHRGSSPFFIFIIHPDKYMNYNTILDEFVHTGWQSVFSRESVGEKNNRLDNNSEPFTADNREILSKLEDEIKKNVKEIWMQDIREDYLNGRLLKEDTLKNSFYFHLRKRLDPLFKQANVVVFTEFRLKELNQIADIAIVQIEPWTPLKAEKNLEDSVINILALFEFKYKSYSKQIEAAIYKDKYKIKQYINTYKDKYRDCRYYYVVLYEELVDPFFWMEKEDAQWAGGYVTELASGYVDDGEMVFDCRDYNL